MTLKTKRTNTLKRRKDNWTDITDIRAELKELREEIHELSITLKSHIKQPTGIFMLPDEVVLIALQYVNQMDVFNLALTHRRFENVCRTKLFQSIYVYDDDTDQTITINIPKRIYTDFYINNTIVGLRRFLNMLSSLYCRPSLIQHIMLENDKFISTSALDIIVKASPNCSIVFGHISFPDTELWIINRQNTTRSKYHWLRNDLEYEFPEDFVPSVKHLVIDCINLYIMKSLNFKLVKTVKINQFPFLGIPAQVVTRSQISSANISTPALLEYFDVLKITQLLITNRCRTHLDDGYIKVRPVSFRSLKILQIDLFIDSMIDFIPGLFMNSLEELYFGCDVRQANKCFGSMLNWHKGSLKVLGFSTSMDKRGYQTGCLYWMKYLYCYADFARVLERHLNINLVDFPLLEQVVGDRQVLVVDRLPREPRLVPLEFHNSKHNATR